MCMPVDDRTKCDADFDEIGVRHADYPHNPGTLYDCPACEQVCHCDADDVVTLGDDREKCVHCQDDDAPEFSEGPYPENDCRADGDAEQIRYESLME
jgi:hypothetical protein